VNQLTEIVNQLTEIGNSVWLYLTSAIGAGVIVVGVANYLASQIANRWLKGVEAKYAKELAHVESELDRLNRQVQARLDHAVTVSRAQFEVEFTALRTVWRRVARARAALNAIAYPPDPPEDDTPDQKLQRFFAARQKFSVAYNRLLHAVDDNSAFYPQEIFGALNALIKCAGIEVRRLGRNQPPLFTEPWTATRETAMKEFLESADRVEQQIRERLASVAIQE
jgi:hypothetical protein